MKTQFNLTRFRSCLRKNTISQFNQFVLEKKKKILLLLFARVASTEIIYCTPLKKSDICDFHVKFVGNVKS